MKIVKKLFAGLLVLTMLFTLVSCGIGKQKSEETPVPEAQVNEKPHIDIIGKGFQHSFWIAVEQGSMQAAEEFGVDVKFQGTNSESDILQQIEYIDEAISKNPAAICIAALDTNAAIPSIQSAQNAGIPIIGFDSGVPDAPEGSIKANASTDNIAAGKLAAQELYKLIKDKVTNPTETVRIGVVAQDLSSQSIKSRTKGFVEEIRAIIGSDKVSVEGPDVFKVEVSGAKVIIEVAIPEKVEDEKAISVASAILEKKDLIAIHGSNEFTANAIIMANGVMNRIGEGKVVAVGFDSGAKQLEAIESKLFAGSVTQDPVQIGYQAVKLAVMAHRGEPVTDVDTGALWYTAENMEDPKIAPCLYR